jgi:hypothetical protein
MWRYRCRGDGRADVTPVELAAILASGRCSRTVVVLSAIIPTAIAQRRYSPDIAADRKAPRKRSAAQSRSAGPSTQINTDLPAR